MTNIFGLKGTFLTWDSKLNFQQKPFWLHVRAEHLEIKTLRKSDTHKTRFDGAIFECLRILYMEPSAPIVMQCARG